MPNQANLEQKPKYSGYAVVGFTLALISCPIFLYLTQIDAPITVIFAPFAFFSATAFPPLAAVIISIIGLREIKKKNMKGKTLAIIGIILGALDLIHWFYILSSLRID